MHITAVNTREIPKNVTKTNSWLKLSMTHLCISLMSIP